MVIETPDRNRSCRLPRSASCHEERPRFVATRPSIVAPYITHRDEATIEEEQHSNGGEEASRRSESDADLCQPK